MDTDVMMIEKNENVNFLACGEIDNFLYFSDWNKNGLFKTNLNNGESEFVAFFDTGYNQIGIHELACVYDRTIWFIPRCIQNKIAVYSPDTGTINYIDIPDFNKPIINRLFSKAVIYNDFIWLLPNDYDAFLQINPKTYEVLRIEHNISRVCEDDSYLFISGILFDGKILLCPYGTDTAIYLDCDRRIVEKLDYEFPLSVYRNVIEIRGKVYFIPRNMPEDILIYDGEKIEKYKVDDTINGSFLGVFQSGENSILLVPLEGEKIAEIDLDTGIINEKKYLIDKKKPNISTGWGEAKRLNEKIIVPSWEINMPALIYENDKLSPMYIRLPQDMDIIYMSAMIDDNKAKQRKIKAVGKKIYHSIVRT